MRKRLMDERNGKGKKKNKTTRKRGKVLSPSHGSRIKTCIEIVKKKHFFLLQIR